MVCVCMCVKSGIPECVSEWVSFLWLVFVCSQDLACVNMFVAGACICLCLFFYLCIYPACSYSQVYVHSHVCVSVCVSVCVQPHFLCACWSILAFGEKDAVHSPRLLRFQHWIRDGAMICGNDFLNANLCFPPLLYLTYSLSLSWSNPHPTPPLLA